MATLPNIILRGTRASQPAAGTAGRLYCVTDEGGIIERDSGSAWQSYSPAAGGGAPTTAEYVTTAADGTLSAEVVIPGLAGSPDVAGVGGAGTAREFKSGDTAPTWSSAPAATDVGTTLASHLYVENNASTELRGLYNWSPAGAFDARTKVTGIGSDDSATGGAFGLLITSSGDSNRLLLELEHSGGSSQYVIAAYTYAGSYSPVGSSWSLTGANDAYLRITRDGSNNVSFWVSSRGTAWQKIYTGSFTLTVANLGFRSTGHATGITHVFVDWLRTDV